MRGSILYPYHIISLSKFPFIFPGFDILICFRVLVIFVYMSLIWSSFKIPSSLQKPVQVLPSITGFSTSFGYAWQHPVIIGIFHHHVNFSFGINKSCGSLSRQETQGRQKGHSTRVSLRQSYRSAAKNMTTLLLTIIFFNMENPLTFW